MSPGPSPAVLHERVLTWWDEHARPLPWREPGCSAWGVFVSEVMSQQTPLSRVEPRWVEWLTRWPTPAALAADSPGEAVRAWDRLGYPRRALRLHEAGMITSTPNKLIAEGTDWRFLHELKRELKA